jgi:hypothetical protein
MQFDDHHLTDDHLSALLKGDLASDDAGVLEAHLLECERCYRRLADLEKNDDFLDLLGRVHFVPPYPVLSSEERSPASPTSLLACASEAQPSDLDSDVRLEITLPVELINHHRYRVLRQLGHGGMGSVWLAEHRVMERPVALKVIHPQHLVQPGIINRFRREVVMTAKLHHPNLAAAYDAELAGNTFFLVMEYVPGEPLSRSLKDGPMAPQAACGAIRQAAIGLAHAHAMGLVHRDVKPSNMLLTSDGVVKLVDFGLVREIDGTNSITAQDSVMGTPDYVAPEQALDPRAATARSDIYSLGCSLYQLLTGSVPYPGRSLVAKLDAHRYLDPPPIVGVPLELSAIVQRMMAKDPDRRIQSAAGVARMLEPYCNGDLPAGEGNARSEFAGKGRSRFRLAGALVLLSAVMAGTAAHFIRGGGLAAGTDASSAAGEDRGPLVRPAIAGSAHGAPDPLQSATLKLLRTFSQGFERAEWRPVVAFSPDLRRVYASSNWGPRGILSWNSSDATLSSEIITTGEGFGFSLSHGGSTLAYSDDRDLIVARSADQTVIHRLNVGGPIWCSTFGADDKLLAVARRDNTVQLWDCETGRLIWGVQGDRGIFNLRISRDAKTIACVGENLSFWSVEQALVKTRLDGIESRTVDVSRDGQWLVTSQGRDLVLFSWKEGRVVRQMRGHNDRIESVCASPDGRHVASADSVGHIFWWSLESGTELSRREFAHQGSILCLALSSDGKQLLSGGKDGNVRLWQIPTEPDQSLQAGLVK